MCVVYMLKQIEENHTQHNTTHYRLKKMLYISAIQLGTQTDGVGNSVPNGHLLWMCFLIIDFAGTIMMMWISCDIDKHSDVDVDVEVDVDVDVDVEMDVNGCGCERHGNLIWITCFMNLI